MKNKYTLPKASLILVDIECSIANGSNRDCEGRPMGNSCKIWGSGNYLDKMVI